MKQIKQDTGTRNSTKYAICLNCSCDMLTMLFFKRYSTQSNELHDIKLWSAFFELHLPRWGQKCWKICLVWMRMVSISNLDRWSGHKATKHEAKCSLL